jgi:hypothetical protein
LLRAETCEGRSKAVVDEELRTEWAMLSIEWHYLASQLSQQKRFEDLTFE